MKTSPKTSVIIASHRLNMVERLLDSILVQEHESCSFEVIIVTDYANGPFQQKYPHFEWLYLADGSISIKRNAGARIARGEYLAFIDDDCIAMPDWIARGSEYLDTHPETAAVEGFTSIASTPAESSAATREYKRLERPGYRTNNLFMRMAAFNNAGGFDERFSVQREDIDLCFTLLEQGGKIDFCRDIRVTHRFRAGEQWDLLKNCWNRRFDPLLFKKHPKLYRKYAGFPLPPSQIPILLLHGLLVISLGRKRLPFIIASTNAVLITALGIRRTGTRPFSLSKLKFEMLQLAIAPLVVIAALVYGTVRIADEEKR
jgi:glycosyltransferase involved in cell wall biosynthesis